MKRRDRTNDPHHVYRCYDKDERLVYVGSTSDLFGRLKTHESQAWWAPQVVKVRAEIYPNGVVARKVESRAIREEVPRWNKAGKWVGRGNWTRADWHDWILVLLREGRLTKQLDTSIKDYQSIYSEPLPAHLAEMLEQVRIERAESQERFRAQLAEQEEQRIKRDTSELRELNEYLERLMDRQAALARALGIDWDDPELVNPEEAINEALAALAKERQS